MELRRLDVKKTRIKVLTKAENHTINDLKNMFGEPVKQNSRFTYFTYDGDIKETQDFIRESKKNGWWI